MGSRSSDRPRTPFLLLGTNSDLVEQCLADAQDGIPVSGVELLLIDAELVEKADRRGLIVKNDTGLLELGIGFSGNRSVREKTLAQPAGASFGLENEHDQVVSHRQDDDPALGLGNGPVEVVLCRMFVGALFFEDHPVPPADQVGMDRPEDVSGVASIDLERKDFLVEQKNRNDIDDKTLIMADIAEKAILQLNHSLERLLTKRMPAEKARQLAGVLSSGHFTHDYPLTYEELLSFDLPVSTDVPDDVYLFMRLFPQPKQAIPSVSYTPFAPPPGRSGNRNS